VLRYRLSILPLPGTRAGAAEEQRRKRHSQSPDGLTRLGEGVSPPGLMQVLHRGSDPAREDLAKTLHVLFGFLRWSAEGGGSS
jgi:hypothetical protein